MDEQDKQLMEVWIKQYDPCNDLNVGIKNHMREAYERGHNMGYSVGFGRGQLDSRREVALRRAIIEQEETIAQLKTDLSERDTTIYSQASTISMMQKELERLRKEKFLHSLAKDCIPEITVNITYRKPFGGSEDA
jgi:flagellar biosynthesis/type III secretory pathway protein FliH